MIVNESPLISVVVQDTVFAALDTVYVEQGADVVEWWNLLVSVGTLILTGFWLWLTYQLLQENTESVKVAQDTLQIQERRHRASMYPTLHYEVVETKVDDRFDYELHVLNLSDKAVFQAQIFVLYKVAITADFWVDSTRNTKVPWVPTCQRENFSEDICSVGINSPLIQRIEIHSFPPDKRYIELLRCPAEPLQFELLVQVRTTDDSNYIQSYFYDKFFKKIVTYHIDEETETLVDFEMNTNWEVIKGTYLTGGNFFGFEPMPRVNLKHKGESHLGYELVSVDDQDVPDGLLRFQELVSSGVMVDQLFRGTSLKPFERYRFEDL